MTATPIAEMLAPPKPAASPAPTPVPSDPIAAARVGMFDRAAIRTHVAKLSADHAAARPALVGKAEAARRAADRARAAADQAEAEARDAAAALAGADFALDHARDRAAWAFAANEPARLTEARAALRQHYGDLRAEPLPGTDAGVRAKGRRLMAVTEAVWELDRLARSGIDGPELEDAIRGLIAGIDRAEATEPPPAPVMPAGVVGLYSAISDRRAKAMAAPSPTAPARVEALTAAQRELAALRPGDPDVMAKAEAIAAGVRVKMPAEQEPYREPPRYRAVPAVADDE